MSKQIVFCATSAYHLICSIYYARKLRGVPCRKVLIWEQTLSRHLELDCVSATFDAIFVVDKVQKKQASLPIRYFNWCLNMGWLFPFSPLRRALATHETVGVLIFSDKDFLAYKIGEQAARLGGKVILVDEGMYTYSILGNTGIKALRRLLGMRKSSYVGEAPYINAIFARRPNDLPKQKTTGRDVVLQDNFLRMKDFIADICSMFDFDLHIPTDITSKRTTILWIGGPLDGVDNADEMTTIRQIIELFPNYSFLIKEHPRERPRKYQELEHFPNVSVLELGKSFWCPVELLVERINPAAVLSFQSSVLCNCSDLGLEFKYCYCFNLLARIEMDSSAFSSFSVHRNIYFPKKMQELFRIVTHQPVHHADHATARGKQGNDIEYLMRLINTSDIVGQLR